ncbi:MAG: polyprenol monophosphomannose synthase [Lentisphaeria bacterium]|jgi:dolichol-phosphate mannosyltransferase
MTATTPPPPPTASIVVPTYREAANLPELVERIAAAMAGAGLPYELIIVDDASGDGTAAVVRRAAAAGHPVRLLERTTERGLSSAVAAGFRAARGDVLVCLDADLSHPPERIPDLLREVRERGAEFAIGSRYVPGGSTAEAWGPFRRLNSRAATLLARPFTRARDPMAGFFALPRRVFAAASPWLDPVGYKIGLELLVKGNCRRVVEVPIHFAERQRGQSKLSLREQLNYLRHLYKLARFRLRHRRPR